MGYLKILNKSLVHHDYKYTVGLNIDCNQWTPHESQIGGLHFCTSEDVHHWLYLGELVADVELPPEAKVSHFDNHSKADRIIICNIRSIGDLPHWNNADFCAKSVELSGRLLQYVPKSFKTKKLIKSALARYPRALQWVPKKYQTDELCEKCLEQDPYAIEFVADQTPDRCLKAVSKYGFAIQYVRNQTIDLCKSAVCNQGKSIQYICDPHIKDQVAMSSVKQNGLALQFINNQTVEMCIEAVKQNGLAYIYINANNKFDSSSLKEIQQVASANNSFGSGILSRNKLVCVE